MGMMTTLDGRLDDPDAWVPSIPDDLYAELDRQYETFDTILVGRTDLLEMVEYWPGAGRRPRARRRPAAAWRSKMNAYRKLVFTSAAGDLDPEWNNAEPVPVSSDEDIVAFVDGPQGAAGRRHPPGSGARGWRAPIVRLGLVDRFHLVTHPIVSRAPPGSPTSASGGSCGCSARPRTRTAWSACSTRRCAASGGPRCRAARPRARGRPARSCARSRSAPASSTSSSRRRRWQSSPGRTSTWAASDGKPEVTSQTCRSWTSTIPGALASARPTSSVRTPSGEPSSRTVEEARRSDQPERSISAETSSAAMPSACSKPAEQHDGARGGRAERRVEVGQHVGAGALDVERAALRARQLPGGRDVDPRAQQADDQHQAALDVGRREQALHGLDGDHAGEHEQRRAVDLRGQDLGAPEAEREAPAGRARGQPRGDQRERQRAGVGEHVGRVGEQRQRAGDHARHHLGDHEGEDQPEGDREPAPVRIRRDRVVVMLMMLVCVDF